MLASLFISYPWRRELSVKHLLKKMYIFAKQWDQIGLPLFKKIMHANPRAPQSACSLVPKATNAHHKAQLPPPPHHHAPPPDAAPQSPTAIYGHRARTISGHRNTWTSGHGSHTLAYKCAYNIWFQVSGIPGRHQCMQSAWWSGSAFCSSVNKLPPVSV